MSENFPKLGAKFLLYFLVLYHEVTSCNVEFELEFVEQEVLVETTVKVLLLQLFSVEVREA